MENINSEEFNFEKCNDMINKIKAGSPVHKINFAIESPNAIAGMYLAATNAKSYLNKILDKKDVEDDTLLVFESRHVIECCQIIYGYLYIVNELKIIKFTQKFIINKIIDNLLIRPIYYSDMIDKMDELADICIIKNSNKSETVLESFKYILENIWFLPYGEIDKIASTAIEEFKKHCKDGENNNE